MNTVHGQTPTVLRPIYSAATFSETGARVHVQQKFCCCCCLCCDFVGCCDAILECSGFAHSCLRRLEKNKQTTVSEKICAAIDVIFELYP